MMKELLIKTLKEAGQIQRENFRKAHTIEQKESISSVVTEVDLLCDKKIATLIAEKFPDHNILTEENGFVNKHSKYTWVIDPIDGTSNFAAGISWFGVLVAVLDNKTPLMAGAYLPIDNKLYFAETGKGAFLNGEKLEISKSLLKDSLVSFATDYTDNTEYLNKGIAIYKALINKSRNIRCTNSLLDFMLVAEGRLGAAVNMFTKIWDIASPWLIIKEAGGLLKSLNGSEIDFDLGENALKKNYGVMAGSQDILNEVKAILP
jgi:myo-inositol-1(or 4)-monophosphatase